MEASPQTTESLAAHLRETVAHAAVAADPGPHMVVLDLLPAATYAELLETIPPADTFDVADKVKANFDPATTMTAPVRSREVWSWFHAGVVERLLTPALLEAFRPALAAAYEQYFGASLVEAALNLPHHAFQGRLMLRRPGYRLRPHRDKKLALLTGLIYFARPGDSPEHGTELYRILDDRETPVMKTYYPEDHGARAELARTVPFVGNTALFFMNVPGMAHGAGIPRDSPQTERYAYQFYVGPPKSDVARLVRQMPPERAATWKLKISDEGY